MVHDDVTVDAICRGELTLRQPRKGYRFNVDSVLLADFVGRLQRAPAELAVDLGAGCGIVGLLLARRGVARRLRLVELQPDLARLAQHNCVANGLARRVDVLAQDLRSPGWQPPGSVDLVVSNPPFFPLRAGRPSGRRQTAVAKHELCCTLGELARVAQRLLRPGGAMGLIHSAARLDEVLLQLEQAGLAPDVVQPVVPLPGREASRVLVWSRRGTGMPPRRWTPVLVERRPGCYSARLREMLGEEAPVDSASGAWFKSDKRENAMHSTVVVGTQWGDEGKGKVVDLLAEDADLVVRFAGGNNAGHTLVVNDAKLVLHLVPSGVLRPDTTAVLGDGMVVDPEVLLDEVAQLAQAGVALGPQRLRISAKAHLILPHHRALDTLREQGRGALGTTRRGIGPAYEDKAARRGVRLGDLLHEQRLARRLQGALEHANAQLEGAGMAAVDLQQTLAMLAPLRQALAPHVDDTSLLVHRALEQGRHVLFEGAQGVLLDLDHGTYPFVTSSSTVAGGVCAGAGVGPRAVGQVVGVAKAYVTRVGSGPFPTELSDEVGERLQRQGHELGATTGRVRRCGWLDLPALRYAVRLCGVDRLALTKLDVLRGVNPLMVCVAYERGGQRLEQLPADLELGDVTPILEPMPGFDDDISGLRCWDDLPQAAQRYVERIERDCGTPVHLISVGPERQQALIRQPKS